MERSEMTHTAGPWKVNAGDLAPYEITINSSQSNRYIAHIAGRTDGEDEANARLIAAAPAMLKALEAADVAQELGRVNARLGTIESLMCCREAEAQAQEWRRHAIAQARGEEVTAMNEAQKFWAGRRCDRHWRLNCPQCTPPAARLTEQHEVAKQALRDVQAVEARLDTLKRP